MCHTIVLDRHVSITSKTRTQPWTLTTWNFYLDLLSIQLYSVTSQLHGVIPCISLVCGILINFTTLVTTPSPFSFSS